MEALERLHIPASSRLSHPRRGQFAHDQSTSSAVTSHAGVPQAVRNRSRSLLAFSMVIAENPRVTWEATNAYTHEVWWAHRSGGAATETLAVSCTSRNREHPRAHLLGAEGFEVTPQESPSVLESQRCRTVPPSRRSAACGPAGTCAHATWLRHDHAQNHRHRHRGPAVAPRPRRVTEGSSHRLAEATAGKGVIALT